MEAVGQLAGGIAHDFNNLLTVISGNTEIAIDAMADADPQRPGLREVLAATERAAALTRQLLAFSRKQLMQPRPVDLNAVVRDLEPILLRLIGEDIVIATRLDPAVPPAMADRGQLDQILMNLALNARDAMPAGGTLRIETGAAPTDRARQTSRAEIAPGDYVLLQVSDTGVGIDPAIQPRVFEPFFTTKEAGKGSGLGLSTVYGIVDSPGATSFWTASRGKGRSSRSTFPARSRWRARDPPDGRPWRITHRRRDRKPSCSPRTKRGFAASRGRSSSNKAIGCWRRCTARTRSTWRHAMRRTDRRAGHRRRDARDGRARAGRASPRAAA